MKRTNVSKPMTEISRLRGPHGSCSLLVAAGMEDGLSHNESRRETPIYLPDIFPVSHGSYWQLRETLTAAQAACPSGSHRGRSRVTGRLTPSVLTCPSSFPIPCSRYRPECQFSKLHTLSDSREHRQAHEGPNRRTYLSQTKRCRKARIGMQKKR